MGTLTKKMQAEQTRAEAIAELQKLCPPGTKVYLVLRSVNRGGTLRKLDAMVLDGDCHRLINHLVERLGLGWKRNRDGHLVTDTCGMDVGAEIVLHMSRLVYGDCHALRHEWI